MGFQTIWGDKEEFPNYDYFEEQAKELGITHKSNFEDVLPMFLGAYKQFGDDPQFADTALKFSYDMQPWAKRTAISFMTPSGGHIPDTVAKQAIDELQDPIFQSKNIGKILSQGENLGAKNNKTGIYGGVPQLLSLFDSIDGTTVQDLQGFMTGLGGLLGLGGGDIENVKQAVDKIDDEDPTIWT